MTKRRVVLAALVAVLVCRVSNGRAASGRVNSFRLTDSRFAAVLDGASGDQQAWMRAHYWRMHVFAPYFDPRLAWFPDAWAFKHLYAVYPDSPLAAAHPDWILHDAAGH